MKIPLLILIDSVHDFLPAIEDRGFRCILATTPEERARAIRDHADEIRVVLTRGATGFRVDEMAALPRLSLICSLGVGFENIDLAAARARGVQVTHGPGANATSVADHAMALLLGVARHLRRPTPGCARDTGAGSWDRRYRASAWASWAWAASAWKSPGAAPMASA